MKINMLDDVVLRNDFYPSSFQLRILSCSKAISLSRGNLIHLFYTLHERSQLITVSSKHFTATNHATNLIQATELHQSHHFVVT